MNLIRGSFVLCNSFVGVIYFWFYLFPARFKYLSPMAWLLAQHAGFFFEKTRKSVDHKCNSLVPMSGGIPRRARTRWSLAAALIPRAVLRSTLRTPIVITNQTADERNFGVLRRWGSSRGPG